MEMKKYFFLRILLLSRFSDSILLLSRFSDQSAFISWLVCSICDLKGSVCEVFEANKVERGFKLD